MLIEDFRGNLKKRIKFLINNEDTEEAVEENAPAFVP